MSTDVTPLAYKTRLGNLTAKSVLVLLSDCANDEGYGWPSEARIAEKTEIRLRTVKRILQVFTEIGIIAKIDRGKHKTPGLQLALDRMGADVSAEFASAYRAAQSKKECRSDIETDVAETQGNVAETSIHVAATFPLKPLIGGTVIGTAKEPTPPTPSLREGGCAPLPFPELDPAQMAHLERLADNPKEHAMWETFYRRDNAERLDAVARKAAEEREEREREERVRAEIPDLAAGKAFVMRACCFHDNGRRGGIGAAVEAALMAHAAIGEEPWIVAPRMAEAWKDQQRQGEKLARRLKPQNFFASDYWANHDGWYWNYELLRRRQEASTGSWQ